MALVFFILGSLITLVVLEYHAWVMPQGYRRFQNRKYQPVEQNPGFPLEMSEEEIIRSSQASNS
jgi:hypothetical protein